MKTDIEKQFIKEYQSGGIVHYCIETIRYSYNLEYIPPKNDNHNEFKKKYYNEILPSRIKQKMGSFDESIITSYDSALLNEISDNLLEYKTKQEKERYILTLIVPFKELSDLLNPELAVKKRMLGMFDEQYERVEMISERFKEILRNPKDEIEKTLSKFNKFKFMFANRLDALCLIHNIDFLDLQHKAGTYLILKRDIGALSFYIGSLELTNYYIDKLPKKEEKQPPQLTKDLKTDVQEHLFDELIKKEFIPKNTNYYHFCYVFGNTTIPENENPFIKITWLKAKYDLRDLLFCDVIKSNVFKTTQIEKKVPNYFQDKKGKPLKLKGNKNNRTSQNYKRMQTIIKDIQKIDKKKATL